VGDCIPAEPVPSEPWASRQAAAQTYARWLSGYRSQAFVGEVLNELGIRTRSGHSWTQSAVSRLIRASAKVHHRTA